MHHNFNFRDVLTVSARIGWTIEDVLPEGAVLDFGRPFLPETLARTGGIGFLDPAEKRLLNQIRGHEYLAMFGLVEEFILPFVLDHARPQLGGISSRPGAAGASEIPADISSGPRSPGIADRDQDDHKVRALLQFASEEAKHIHLFKRFQALFTDSFATRCEMIGPPQAIAAEVLRHDPLAVALVILQVEWMTQAHYLGSVRDDGDMDPLFKSLLRHHWMEEAQHAKLDTLMVEALAQDRDGAGIARAIDEYFEIAAFLDAGLAAQARMNLDAFERASGRRLTAAEREALEPGQHQALRWTYLGSGMTHPRFTATLAHLSNDARDRIAAAAPAFS